MVECEFHVGDFVIAKRGAVYSVTNPNVICVVKGLRSNEKKMLVTPVCVIDRYNYGAVKRYGDARLEYIEKSIEEEERFLVQVCMFEPFVDNSYFEYEDVDVESLWT